LNEGRLEGEGQVGAFVGGGSVVSPGTNGPGTLTFTEGFTATNTTTLALGLKDGGDRLAVRGTVQLGDCLLQLEPLPGVPVGTEFILIDNDAQDAVSGRFQGRVDGALFDASGQLWRLWYGRGTGNDVVLVRDDGGARLQAARVGAGGAFLFQGRGTNYATYTIEATTNLTTPDWEFLGNAVADPSGLFQFIDTDRTNYPIRFYRSYGP
jgi:hypothetical protein